MAVPPDTKELHGSKNGDRSTLVGAEPFVSGRIEWSLKDFLSCRSEFYAEKAAAPSFMIIRHAPWRHHTVYEEV